MTQVPIDSSKPDGPTRPKRLPQGDAIPNYFPAIITEKEFYRVRQGCNARRKEKGPRGKVGIANLFTGLLRDARDGQTMHLQYRGSALKANTRVLVSYGTRNAEIGSEFTPFPYDAVERAFLKWVRDVKAGDITVGPENDFVDELAALSGKVHEIDQKINTVQKRIMQSGEGIDALVTMLERLSKERKEKAANCERLKAQQAHSQPAALQETQSLADLLANASTEQQFELRLKIRSRIKQIVAEMWLFPWDVTPMIRAAEIQVVLHSGKVWGLCLAWLRRGKHRGLISGIGAVIARPGQDSHLADKLLRDYRTNPSVHEYFEWHLKRMAPAIQRSVEAEKAARDAINAVNSLERSKRVGG